MSLCDVCPRPGRCCTGLELWQDGQPFPQTEVPLMALAELASCEPAAGEIGVPFMLLSHHNGRWRFWCPNLTPEGRCGIYENRPNLCRTYRPMQDALCAMHTNAITREAFTPRLT